MNDFIAQFLWLVAGVAFVLGFIAFCVWMNQK